MGAQLTKGLRIFAAFYIIIPGKQNLDYVELRRL